MWALRPGRPEPLRSFVDRAAPGIFGPASRYGDDLRRFEAEMLPLLLPGGDRTPAAAVADLDGWRGSPFFLQWLRRTYIELAHPVPPAAADALRSPGARSGLWMPGFAEVHGLLGLAAPDPATWRAATVEDAAARRRELLRAAGVGGESAGGGEGGGEGGAEWDLHDVIEAAGGAVWGRTAMNAFIEKHGLWQLLNREMVAELAAHLARRCAELDSAERASSSSSSSPSPGPKQARKGKKARRAAAEAPVLARQRVVLEVGAGDGQLGNALVAALGAGAGGLKGSGGSTGAADVDYVMTDVTPLVSLAGAQAPDVLRADYRAALARFRPDIVVCSWMPMGEDWTADFRACESVQEYVLVGEADCGCCGDHWRTFGNAAHAPAGFEEGVAPPHEQDGFTKVYLDGVSRYCLERFDSAHYGGNSRAVAFRRRD